MRKIYDERVWFHELYPTSVSRSADRNMNTTPLSKAKACTACRQVKVCGPLSHS